MKDTVIFDEFDIIDWNPIYVSNSSNIEI